MKKFIYLSALLVFLFTLSGCNLFENMDSYSDNDDDVFYYNAKSTINSGDNAKLKELEATITAKLASNPANTAALELLLADVRLALSGVDLLKAATDIFDMVNNSDDLSYTATNITSIISMDDDQLAYLKQSIDTYNTTLDLAYLKQSILTYNSTLVLTPDLASLTSEDRNQYMSAGIANVMYSANTILNVFDTNGDDKIDELDTYADFKQTDWNNVKTDLITSLESSVAYLNVAFQNNTSDGQATTDNEEMVQTINEIKTNLNNYNTISSTDFTTIINTVLTGK